MVVNQTRPERHLTTKEQRLIDGALRRSLRLLCEDCGKCWADYPSKLCPGCEAYREHTGHV